MKYMIDFAFISTLDTIEATAFNCVERSIVQNLLLLPFSGRKSSVGHNVIKSVYNLQLEYPVYLKSELGHRSYHRSIVIFRAIGENIFVYS